MYSVIFNEKNCENYGIVPVRRPDIPAPETRVTEHEIAGRDGVLIETDETYKPIEIEIEFNFLSEEDRWAETFREAKKWIRGSGWLEMEDDPRYLYKVYHCRITSAERASRRVGNFKARFVCDPYLFLKSGQMEYDYNSVEIRNNINETSHPIYKITGNGTCTLTVNGNIMKADITQNLTIDTDRMLAYRQDGSMQNTSVSGDYEGLYLIPGENAISITNGFNLAVIPNWRCL